MFRVRHLLPISPDLIERVERTALPGENVFGGLAPDERLRLGVVQQQIVVDRVLEVVDAGVATATDALCGDLGEEAFDQVHPGRACRSEMQLEAGMLVQPGLHLGRLVGRIVVENQMNVPRFFSPPSRCGAESSGTLWRGDTACIPR